MSERQPDNEIPRRNKIYEMSSGELAIRRAVQEVEKMGADIRLTDAVILLGQAKDHVADFVDGIGPRIPTPGETSKLLGKCHDLVHNLIAYPTWKPDSEYLRKLHEPLAAIVDGVILPPGETGATIDDAIAYIREHWLAAYPEDIFIPPTTEECKAAHAALKAIGLSIDKFSGEMGRQVAKCLIQELGELKGQPPADSAAIRERNSEIKLRLSNGLHHLGTRKSGDFVDADLKWLIETVERLLG